MATAASLAKAGIQVSPMGTTSTDRCMLYGVNVTAGEGGRARWNHDVLNTSFLGSMSHLTGMALSHQGLAVVAETCCSDWPPSYVRAAG